MRSLLAVALLSLALVSGAEDNARGQPPQPLHAFPVQVPADFCFGAVDSLKSCDVAVSFTILPDGTVSEVKVVKSSKNRPCDRSAVVSVQSRVYPKAGVFKVTNERVRSQTCKAAFGP
jgi:TonB family protein